MRGLCRRQSADSGTDDDADTLRGILDRPLRARCADRSREPPSPPRRGRNGRSDCSAAPPADPIQERGSKSFTSAAIRVFRLPVSKRVIGPTPLLPASSAVHVPSTPVASGVTRPRPVTTTRRPCMSETRVPQGRNRTTLARPSNVENEAEEMNQILPPGTAAAPARRGRARESLGDSPATDSIARDAVTPVPGASRSVWLLRPGRRSEGDLLLALSGQILEGTLRSDRTEEPHPELRGGAHPPHRLRSVGSGWLGAPDRTPAPPPPGFDRADGGAIGRAVSRNRVRPERDLDVTGGGVIDVKRAEIRAIGTIVLKAELHRSGKRRQIEPGRHSERLDQKVVVRGEGAAPHGRSSTRAPRGHRFSGLTALNDQRPEAAKQLWTEEAGAGVETVHQNQEIFADELPGTGNDEVLPRVPRVGHLRRDALQGMSATLEA